MNTDQLFYTKDFTESGFIFSPFNSDENTILFPIKEADFITEKIQIEERYILKDSLLNVGEANKEQHIQLVEKALGQINNKVLKKVVVSRNEDIVLEHFNLLTTFKKILKTYPNAFVYVWFHPKVGLWFGATPETLLTISGQQFETMSLAGTQVFVDHKVVWKNKELEEQQLVTNFIENQLKPLTTKLVTDKTETVKAGNLLHLKTRVDGALNSFSSLKELIRALHPTPAVCGLPREKAKLFINTNEPYKRTFYTGFLGELNFENKYSSLFVNLRCMTVDDSIATIFVGGGITKESNENKEWEETIAKTKTMKQVL
ncbi:MAG: isochorismate synthase [Polaribacter sp.]|nr:isochorismate synthase [Polaribacter sp.]